jgi:hypothetical protein
MNVCKYKIKYLILILVLAISVNAKSRGMRILHCLAQEETSFHRRRYTGPEFALNQKLINKLASIGHYKVTAYALNNVCKATKPGPTVTFLQMLILEPDTIFTEDKNTEESLKVLNHSAIESLKEEASKLLFEYLSDIQSLSTDAKCLEKEIPQIKYYWERFQFLETTIGTGSIVDDPDKIHQIFKKLVHIDKILLKCNKANPRP